MYVGYATNFLHRWAVHRYDMRRGKHHSIHLQRAINIYGIDKFKFEVLEECEEQFLCGQEHYWCLMLDTHNDKYGYNDQLTHPYGLVRPSEETKKKMRKPRNLTQEQRDRLSYRAIHITRHPGAAVMCFNLKGMLLCEYESVAECSRKLGIKRTWITDVLMGRSRLCKEFNFIYKKDYDPDKDYSVTIVHKQEVQKFSIVGELLAEYKTVKDAASDNNVSACGVSTVCLHYLDGRYPNTKLKGFIYKYKNYTKNYTK